MDIIYAVIMMLGTNQIAGITNDFKMDIIYAVIMLLGTNQIAGITSDFKIGLITGYPILPYTCCNDKRLFEFTEQVSSYEAMLAERTRGTTFFHGNSKAAKGFCQKRGNEISILIKASVVFLFFFCIYRGKDFSLMKNVSASIETIFFGKSNDDDDDDDNIGDNVMMMW